MSIVFEEVKEAAEFDIGKFSLAAPFTQSFEYGEWQREVGRNVRRWVGKEGGAIIGAVQLIEYPLAKNKTYWYAPYGPVWKEKPDEHYLEALKTKLEELVQETASVFVRIELPSSLQPKGLKTAPSVTTRGSFLQPRAEWVLDIKESEERLLREMHHNTRYSIRAAERRGVRTEVIEGQKLPEHFEEFYALLEETAKRDAFTLHAKEYYEGVFRVSAENNSAFLVLAKHEMNILAAHFIVCCGRQANFVFGGSSSSHRELMGSYAAQWTAIRKAKTLGITRYNFGGVTAEIDAREQWGGLSSFKRKFGGTLLEHGHFRDLIGNKFWYYSYVARKFLGTLGI
ncbi:MAG: peptidoglycan bridge formation glycyltransferase FemA/FemB family protein [Candidatus Liptonbacteria bacterium]|nr:peptidoglycan bridge formation glycyltransferase FemA/FemB family protein [Candidatus Liptonbacteria bacterium]